MKMAKLNSRFVSGALQLLLACSVLTFVAANSTTITPSTTTSNSSLSHSTISPNANSVNASRILPNSCSTIRSCIKATVNATGIAPNTSVSSSCNMVTVSCFGNASNTTKTLSTSSITTTTTTTTATTAATTTTTIVSHTSSGVGSPQTSTPTPLLSSTPSSPTNSSSAVHAAPNVTQVPNTIATPSSNSTSSANTSSVNSTTSNSITATAMTVSGATSVYTVGSLMPSITPSPSVSGASTSQSSSNDSTTSASQSTSVSPTNTSPTNGVTNSTMIAATSSSTSKPSSNDSTVNNNQSSTVSPTIARTTAYVPSTSPPKIKSVSMKVTFEIQFKEEYNNRQSKAYKDLKDNFTKILEEPLSKMVGFIRVDILFFREGSVVCNFDVIFNETASPKPEDVEKNLQEASKSGSLGGYAVKNIEAEEEKKDDEKKDDLPLWATVTLILLGALGLVLLITVIILAVLLRRNKESSPLYQVSGEDWTQYESMSMGDYKTRAAEVERGKLRNGGNNQLVYENHPTSHSNLSYQVPSNGQ